ncbi:polysaccharide export outer membrane protein [Erythromicrobium ramosum]|uniref:Polysaccharide export outer membrane protein n=1 Tax=Erythrobacter ramosus TaxID=35811 RepID=A0A6I4UKM7_9SPHN|nr:polysaccharide biosynthesis/export family protein [Erythrobacter ramosus]MBB3774410.1 polysaccharide export outer membrane protein [Erythrobacter ramosus]MXP37939.1 polysaccharide export protein [Erythrobacter ramosus]
MNRPSSVTGTVARPLLALLLAGLAGACTTLGAAGPSSGQVRKAEGADYAGSQVVLVDLDPLTYKRIAAFEQSLGLAQQFGEGGAGEVLIGPGDVLDIAMWEAPPAVLFGGGGVIPGLDAGAQNRTVVQQVVDGTGMISVPFAGTIEAAGQTPAAIERAIVARLAGRANDPQVNVRLSLNDSRNVTVLGEIAASRRVPLGPRGERLLDIIASVGGPRAPVHQTTVQVSRGGASATMALEAIIAQPAQNIRMRPEDVVTVLHQPYSFIAMGAVATSAEIPFEGRGISLAQALARVGGLRDNQANIRGVFVFRLEQPDALDPAKRMATQALEDGRVPVIYRLDLSDARGFFVAQEFQIHDQDVVYVSTAPGAELREFLSTVTSLAFSAIAIGNVVTNNGN